jgi:hypothetical protein
VTAAERRGAPGVGPVMARANIHDRQSLARVYPADAFAGDAAQNDRPAAPMLRGIRIASAPDAAGWFELERAARHAGEPAAAEFLAPVRREAELLDAGRAPVQRAEPTPRHGYEAFLDDILAAAGRVGFKAQDSPGPGDARLRGLRQ